MLINNDQVGSVVFFSAQRKLRKLGPAGTIKVNQDRFIAKCYLSQPEDLVYSHLILDIFSKGAYRFLLSLEASI